MKTFELQAKLPHLPVPKLEKSLELLEHSLQPFLHTSTQSASELHSEIEDFKRSLGPVLQRRLEEYARGKDNWLDAWWLRLAYLSWREALVVNSNWFMVFADHPEMPASMRESSFALPDGHVSLFQLYRSAGLICNSLKFKEMIEREEIPVEMYGRGDDLKPLCMQQFKLIFGWTRVAVGGCDQLVCPGGFPSKSKHIVVLFKSHVYALDVYDNNGSRLSIRALEQQLMYIVNHCFNLVEKQPPVCILTGDHRDNWSEARVHLLSLSEKNKRSMAVIESALFAIALDDHSLGDSFDLNYQNIAHGMTGYNRWYDKSFNLVTTSNGKTGMNGEHSPCDALIPSRLQDFLVEQEPARDPPGVVDISRSRKPYLLEWDSDSKLEGYLTRAANTVAGIIKDSDAGVLIFRGYGSEFMKKAKVSPDAYVQMTLQLAYYRMHRKWTATYETGATRQFLLGRTETVRTCSVDAVEFVKTFCKGDATPVQKVQALQKACKAHSAYTIRAMKGEGCDRHLLGLKVCLKDGEGHPFLKNPLLAESTHYRLSTSSLSTGENYNGTGFGSVYHDGYGINYCIGKNVVKFGIESKNSCFETSTDAFRGAITDAFYDLRNVLEQSINAKL